MNFLCGWFFARALGPPRKYDNLLDLLVVLWFLGIVGCCFSLFVRFEAEKGKPSHGEIVLPLNANAHASVFAKQFTPPPEYPAEAALDGQEGTVEVMIHVRPDGTVAGVNLLSSSGYVLLDNAARDAALRWRFPPSAGKFDTPATFKFDEATASID